MRQILPDDEIVKGINSSNSKKRKSSKQHEVFYLDLREYQQ